MYQLTLINHIDLAVIFGLHMISGIKRKFTLESLEFFLNFHGIQ